MKRLSKVMLPFLVATSLLVVAGSATAGLRLVYPVSLGATFANGSLGSARNSGDTTQYISAQSNGSWAWFFATDAAGKTGSCTTIDPVLVRLAESVAQDAYLHFSWDKLGKCSGVHVTHGSYLEPALP